MLIWTGGLKMPATYEPIATTTLGSAVSSITFSSIPITYTDLKLVLTINGVSSTTGSYVFIYPNSQQTATNYSYIQMQGNGSATSSTSVQNSFIQTRNVMPSTTAIAVYIADILNYANGTNKTILTTFTSDNAGSGVTEFTAGNWRSNSNITSLLLTISSSATVNFGVGTTATLYGILKA